MLSKLTFNLEIVNTFFLIIKKKKKNANTLPFRSGGKENLFLKLKLIHLFQKITAKKKKKKLCRIQLTAVTIRTKMIKTKYVKKRKDTL